MIIAANSTHFPAAGARAHLEVLEAERAGALLAGLHENDAYMDDLLEEIADSRSAYVGLAVSEIAELRGELSGRLRG